MNLRKPVEFLVSIALATVFNTANNTCNGSNYSLLQPSAYWDGSSSTAWSNSANWSTIIYTNLCIQSANHSSWDNLPTAVSSLPSTTTTTVWIKGYLGSTIYQGSGSNVSLSTLQDGYNTGGAPYTIYGGSFTAGVLRLNGGGAVFTQTNNVGHSSTSSVGSVTLTSLNISSDTYNGTAVSNSNSGDYTQSGQYILEYGTLKSDTINIGNAYTQSSGALFDWAGGTLIKNSPNVTQDINVTYKGLFIDDYMYTNDESLSQSLGSTFNVDGGNIRVNSATVNGQALLRTLTLSGVVTFSSNLQGTNTSNCVKDGAGNLLLTGHVYYYGNTTLEVYAGAINYKLAGVDFVGTNAVLQIDAGASVTTSGTIDPFSTSSNVLSIYSVSSTSSLTLANGTNSIGSLTGLGTINNSDILTINLGSYGGIISGSGSIVKSSSGTLILSGANTYSGNTTVTNGILKAGSSTAFGNHASTITVNQNGTLDLNGQTLNVTGQSLILNDGGYLSSGALINSSSTAATWAGNITLGSGSTIGGSGNITLSGVISGGTNGLTKNGSNTLILCNTNTYTGNTTINAGTLQLGDGDTHSGVVAGNITNNSNLVFSSSNNQTYSGIINGSGNLIKAGNGTLTLTNTNTYTGNTTINAGTLQLGDGTVNGVINGNIVNNAALTFVNPQNQSHNGNISGAGSLTKSGAGILTLAGNNSNFSGNTLVSSGTLQAGSNTALGTSNITVSSGAVLDLHGQALTNSNQQLTLNGNGINSVGALVNSTGVATFSGNVTLASTGSMGGTGDIILAGNVATNFNLTKVGSGTLTLNGVTSGTGELIVSGGTVVVANDLALGSRLVSSMVGYNGAGTLTQTAGTSTYVDSLLIGFTSTGIYNLENSASLYVPSIPLGLFGQGTFNQNGATSSFIANTMMGNNGIYNQNGGTANVTNLTGSGTFNLNGGTLTVAGSSTNLNVLKFNMNGGTLVTSANYTTSTTLKLNTNGGTISPDGGTTLTISQAITNIGTTPGALTKGGAGTLVLTNAGNTYSGGTIVNSGILRFGTPSALPAGTALTINNTGKVVFDSQTSPSTAAPIVLNQSSFSLNGNGTLDIKDNGLIIHNGNLNTTRLALLSGYASGTWTGNGITTSVSASSGSMIVTGIGYLLGGDYSNLTATTFHGVTVQSSDAVAKYTYFGDMNLDGAIDSADASMFENSYTSGIYATSGATWINGDFNYDGKVDATDQALFDAGYAYYQSQGSVPLAAMAPNGLNLLARTNLRASETLATEYSDDMLLAEILNYSRDVGSDYGVDLIPSQSTNPVPEPASLGLLALGVVGLVRRRAWHR